MILIPTLTAAYNLIEALPDNRPQDGLLLSLMVWSYCDTTGLDPYIVAEIHDRLALNVACTRGFST